jgi:serine/threonine protein kinase
MGEAYRARDTSLSRDDALKILPEAFANDPDRIARFRREALLLASLNHPHIGPSTDWKNRAAFLCSCSSWSKAPRWRTE